MIEIPGLRNGKPYCSLDVMPLVGVRAEPLAGVHHSSSLSVARIVDEVRASVPPLAESHEALCAAIERAGELFLGTVGGLTVDECAKALALATGNPEYWTSRALSGLAQSMRTIREALIWQSPQGDAGAFSTRRVVFSGGREAAWVPVGRVLGFVGSSNAPGVNFTWLQALAMGWGVVLKAGGNDPITPWRLSLALLEAGFPMERLAIVSGGHDLVHAICKLCDRTIAYGGPALRASLGESPGIQFNGPGHSKVLVDAPVDVQLTSDYLLESIADGGGVRCTCASGILVRGSMPDLVDEVSHRLAALPLLDPLDPEARVPAMKMTDGSPARPARVVTRGSLRFIQPELVRCASAYDPPFAMELPVPWATVVEIGADVDPLPALQNTLALTLLSNDERLRDLCLAEPSIDKVFLGPVPTWYFEGGSPHHGRLSEFLFVTKSCFQRPMAVLGLPAPRAGELVSPP